MTAELSSVSHQSLDGSAVNSPRSRRQNLPSPWAQVVRGGGGEHEPVSIATSSAAAPEQTPPITTDSSPALTDSGPSQPAAAAADETSVVVGSSSDGGNAKKAVWNKPLNGAAADTSPVMMGADTWPALSESTRPGAKSASESYSKPVPDVSISPPQGPVISHTPHKPAKTNANATRNHNHGHPARHKSFKRSNSGASGAGSSGFTRPTPPPPPTPPPLPPPFPMFEVPHPNLVSPVMDAPVRGEVPFKGNNNWSPRPMGNHRRGNFVGGRPGGDGPYANGYGGRHDPRGSNARDVHMPHQMVPPPPHAPRAFIRPPHPGAPPFMAPQPLRPFGNPMGFDMPSPYLYLPALPPEAFRGPPLMPHATPMFFPVMDPPLHTLILNQIDYYFSESNLSKDKYLRSNMDNEAWVPVSLIANFPRVQSLTNDIQLILNSLRNSIVVEVQGEKVRPRNDWNKWVNNSGKLPADSIKHESDGSLKLPADSIKHGSDSSLKLPADSSESGSDSSLPTSFQKLAIDEETTKLKITSGSSDTDLENVPGLTSEQELTDQSKLTNGEIIAEACSSNI